MCGSIFSDKNLPSDLFSQSLSASDALPLGNLHWESYRQRVLLETGFVLCGQRALLFSPRMRQIKLVHRVRVSKRVTAKPASPEEAVPSLLLRSCTQQQAGTPRQSNSRFQLPAGAGSCIHTTTQNRSLNKCRAFCATRSELKQIMTVTLLHYSL